MPQPLSQGHAVRRFENRGLPLYQHAGVVLSSPSQLRAPLLPATPAPNEEPYQTAVLATTSPATPSLMSRLPCRASPRFRLSLPVVQAAAEMQPEAAPPFKRHAWPIRSVKVLGNGRPCRPPIEGDSQGMAENAPSPGDIVLKAVIASKSMVQHRGQVQVSTKGNTTVLVVFLFDPSSGNPGDHERRSLGISRSFFCARSYRYNGLPAGHGRACHDVTA